MLLATLTLPFILQSKVEPLTQITFSDLLRIAADEAPQFTEASFFSIDIPKINAKTKIIPNVDAADKFEYGQALSRGVAHAAGTFLPDMNGGGGDFVCPLDGFYRPCQPVQRGFLPPGRVNGGGLGHGLVLG